MPSATPAERGHPHRQRLHQGPHPRKLTTPRCAKHLAAGRVVVTTGFQGVDELGHHDASRGGSGHVRGWRSGLKADECLIYTDVDGVYTTDPSHRAGSLAHEHHLVRRDAEMASLASKVLQIRSVEFVGKYRVPFACCPASPLGHSAGRRSQVGHPDHF